MKLYSQINLQTQTVTLTVDGLKYNFAAQHKKDGLTYRYLLSKPSIEEARKYASLLKDRRMANRTIIRNHPSGAYRIYIYQNLAHPTIMKITSITSLSGDTVILTVDKTKYELKATRKIDGKRFRYYRSNATEAEAIASADILKERGLADATRIIKHKSGAYLIYKYKDWKTKSKNQ